MREKLCLNCSIAALQRITPACAGKTLYTRHSYHNLWDHPRVCGKNRACARCYAEGLGSPPRVREKQESMQSSRVPLRITPARAGKTTGCTGCVGCGGDHPRACGKNYWLYWLRWLRRGSPPRVREKLKLLITPITWSRDHPRVCGKNPNTSNTANLYEGSPPRVREKPLPRVSGVCACRITPACAGKTIYKKHLELLGKDHPRVCGKNFTCSCERSKS